MEGTDTFNLRNANPANSYTYAIPGNTTLQVSRTLPSSYFVSLEYYNTEQKVVYAGPAVDVMNITSFASGELSFHGGGGDDALNLPTSSDFIGRRVNFFGDAGTGNRINQITNSKTTPSTLHVAQNSIGAFPGDDFFASGGSVTFNSVQVVQLRMGSGADTAYAQPDAVAAISIIGGNPTTAPGDTLNLALANAPGYAVNGTAASGSVTSSLKTLSYSGFETGPTIDDVAPAVVNANINIDGGALAGAGLRGRTPPRQQTVDVQFSEMMGQVTPASLSLTNLTTGEVVPPENIAVAFDATSNIAHFTFPGYAGGILPDGNYHGTLLASQTADSFGNALAADAPFDFFVLAGDANHDRIVDVSDLGVLATNWQSSDKVFSEGDFNYDGVVDVSDLGVLATNWQKTLPTPTTAAATPRVPFATSPFSVSGAVKHTKPAATTRLVELAILR